ncbi:hypothetical protein BRADI_1g29022v3 [Brachypodium distachyon]|uniref:Reverse transcriptase zinc-binding domain-containing protein n=1 Tax=Brachypodium distachyon TaxID=15368 RepID=A0A2K2DLT1_BRADI|nr:hypothetical protein BRADI_1g29022v3 [Brachypodium distachyon]
MRTVREELDGAWIADVGPDLWGEALQEFFTLWDWTRDLLLDDSVPDSLTWSWSKGDCYTAKSVYLNLFAGRAEDPMAKELTRRGLQHPPRCPLCDQEMETICHLLLGCVVARKVWTSLLSSRGHADWIPEADSRLRDWWTSLPLPCQTRKDFRTAIILVLWTIWRHRNDVVFNGASLAAARIL